MPMTKFEGYSDYENEILNAVLARVKSPGSILRWNSLSYDEIIEKELKRRRFVMLLMLKAKLLEQKAAAKISTK